MKRITRIIRPIICMDVLLFARTTAVTGCYYAHCENEIGSRDKLDRTPPFSATSPATANRTVCGSPSYTAIWTQTSQRSIRISISLWMART